MAKKFPVTPRTRTRQLARKASYDVEQVHAILDAGLCAQVAFVQDGEPVVVPMLYGREGDQLYLHGARKARVVRLLEQTPRACVNVTLLDGVVIARSMFNCSMNYRSVTVFGRPSLIDDPDAKLAAMRVISEHMLPGRWDEARPSHEREVKMTGVIALPIAEASAKISSGMPQDEEEDYAQRVWAGVLPLRSQFLELTDDERLEPGVTASAALRALQHKVL